MEAKGLSHIIQRRGALALTAAFVDSSNFKSIVAMALAAGTIPSSILASNSVSRKSSDNDYITSDPSSDEEYVARSRKRAVGADAPAAGKAARPTPKRPPGAVTLKALIDDGFLSAGEEAMCVEYKGNVTYGDLGADGKIRYQGMTFESPSAFSIYLKRLVNPGRKADDGWKTVKYSGHFLEKYKMAYVMKTQPPAAVEGADEPPAKRAKAGAPAVPKEPVRAADGQPQLRQLPAKAAQREAPAEEDLQPSTSPSNRSAPGHYSDEDQPSSSGVDGGGGGGLASSLYPPRPYVIKAPCCCGQSGGAEAARCQAYSGLPGFATGQPFHLKVAPLAQVGMNSTRAPERTR